MATAAALIVPKVADSLRNLVSRSSYAHFKHYLQLSIVSAHDRRFKFETQVFQTGFIALFTRQKNFEGLVWLLKMVFKCRNAWCAPSMDRAIVHCQRYPLRKPKLSRNKDILSDHFSVLNFCLVFFFFLLLGGFFVVSVRLFIVI